MKGAPDFVGQMLGLIIAGGAGGILLAVVGGPGIGILGVLIGLAVAFGLVRVLMNEASIRPVLRWLYPYEGWTGANDDTGDYS